jgi:predicted DNA-binding protein with PD1-like motif
MSHLLGAKVLFLTEMVVVEVVAPKFRRIPDAALYNVGLLSFLRNE